MFEKVSKETSIFQGQQQSHFLIEGFTGGEWGSKWIILFQIFVSKQ